MSNECIDIAMYLAGAPLLRSLHTLIGGHEFLSMGVAADADEQWRQTHRPQANPPLERFMPLSAVRTLSGQRGVCPRTAVRFARPLKKWLSNAVFQGLEALAWALLYLSRKLHSIPHGEPP